jgi:hypothetical protein
MIAGGRDFSGSATAPSGVPPSSPGASQMPRGRSLTGSPFTLGFVGDSPSPKSQEPQMSETVAGTLVDVVPYGSAHAECRTFPRVGRG